MSEIGIPGQRDAAPPSEVTAHLTPGERAIVVRCLSIIAILSAGSMVGVASSLYLATHYPLLLVGLSPIADFGSSTRPYTAPDSEALIENKNAPDLSGRGHSVLMEHETRFELAVRVAGYAHSYESLALRSRFALTLATCCDP